MGVRAEALTFPIAVPVWSGGADKWWEYRLPYPPGDGQFRDDMDKWLAEKGLPCPADYPPRGS